MDVKQRHKAGRGEGGEAALGMYGMRVPVLSGNWCKVNLSVVSV